MRILHTSDWHLGKSLETKTRYEEQQHLIDEISDIIDRKNIDVVREVQVEHAQNGVVLKKEELNRANQIQQDSGESRKTLFIALLLVGVILIIVMVFLKRKK